MYFFSQEDYFLQDAVRQFSQSELAPSLAYFEEQETLNLAAFRKMGPLGWLGITVPLEDGGSGQGAVAATLILEELATVDASTALSFLSHAILCVHQVAQNCTPAQKAHSLQALLSGASIGGMAMSEPEAGSDALGMTTKAQYQATQDSYLLNGTKAWVTNGPVGDFFYTYARTGADKKQISSFLIPRSLAGLSLGKKLKKLGMRASPTCELIFEQCQVPASLRVGEEGGSVYLMMKNLDLERITIAGISLGIAQAALAVATLYATQRKAFGKTIGSFQQIQAQLADASASLAACRALTYQAAKMWDLNLLNGKQAGVMAAQAKLQSAQMATQVSLVAIQILGGSGYTREFPVERYLRDAKLIEIGAGTNEILRLIIAKQMLNTAQTEVTLSQPASSLPPTGLHSPHATGITL